MDTVKQRIALQRTYINYTEWARCNNINSTIYQLNSELWGFVYKSSFGEYLIVVNSILSTELQKEVFCHEVEHIIYDMPDKSYFIGLDMQYESIEKKADSVAEAIGDIFFG